MKTRALLVAAAILLPCAVGLAASGEPNATKVEPGRPIVVVTEAPVEESATSATVAAPVVIAPRPNEQGADRGAERVSRDARISYGDIKISRTRFGESNSLSGGTARANSTAAIAVPSNTIGPGESLQQIATRETAERRSAEASVREQEATAEIARTEAALAEDRIRDGVSYIGFSGGYPIYGPVGYRGGYAAGSQGHRWNSRRGRGEAGVTVERFKSDAAIHAFSQAATPPIARIQHQTDRAVIGDRLDRERVRTKAKPK